MKRVMINIKNPLFLVEWLLRIGIFLTFFGHGYIAVNKNIAWLPYLEVVGFSVPMALNLMVIIGVLDIIIALTSLIKPNKYIVLWACFWAFSTALIRPISGEPIWAFVERGSNWAVPLALYFLIYVNKRNH